MKLTAMVLLASALLAPACAAEVTVGDQSQDAEDVRITGEIRRAVMADGSLSFRAKNAKIITTAGNVALRGEVADDSEKAAIESIALSSGARAVDNQLAVSAG